ncbi:NAD-dependent epimerase/dehydratase family protein [Plantactinospora solaniradicis]|uniref:NAD-dependent epimerase/dehydratase family protein n=1 Tax=Plantactinospora solaniradicis TaxID=1723736 RepID=A0ABW1KA31_9ACTN
MRIAVTGGAGRVGRAVVGLALAEGHTVVEIDRPEVAAGAGEPPPDLVRRPADVTAYPELLRALAGCDALVHLAAHPKPWDRPDHVVHNENVTASYNALRAAAELGIERICLASSVNAIGGGYSRNPRFDYFPLDERHPSYNEDPYSLSKWIVEAQADSFARRYENLTIASLRLHAVLANRPATPPDRVHSDFAVRDLWGYTLSRPAARACLLALTADFTGHEVFYIVAPRTWHPRPTVELCREHYPEVPIRGELRGNQALYDCTKAERLLGWCHDDDGPAR